jgi:quercetin dioxygenase-like cupin family protein
MALIILESGERFDHLHPTPSTTTLVRGKVRFLLGGVETPLAKGQTIEVPANMPHELINLGRTRAAIGCGHGVGGRV